MSKFDEYVKLGAVDIAVGETSRDIACPSCGHDKDFTVSRTREGILYHCYRAKCGIRGFAPTIASSITSRKKGKKKKPKTHMRPLARLPAGICRWITQKYNIPSDEILDNHFKWDYTVNYLYMPIYNSIGYEIGACIKRLPERFCRKDTNKEYYETQNKVVHYWFNDNAVKLHYPPRVKSSLHDKPVVLVEDTLSAIRVSQFAPAIALLGHNISDSMIKDIRQHTRRVILALDKDTWYMRKRGLLPTPLYFKKKFGLFFDEFRIVQVPCDPKSMDDKQIQEMIQ